MLLGTFFLGGGIPGFDYNAGYVGGLSFWQLAIRAQIYVEANARYLIPCVI